MFGKCVPTLLSQARLAGAQDRFSSVDDSEFGEDVRDVVTNGLGSDSKPTGNVGVVESSSQEVKNLRFAIRQRRESDVRAQWARFREFSEDLVRDGWAEHGISSGHALHSSDDIGWLGSLDGVAAGAGAHCGQHRSVVVEHREHEDSYLWRSGEDPARRLNPVDVGEVHIHDHDIGLEGKGKIGRFETSCGFADDDKIARGVQKRTQATSNDWVVVDHEDAGWGLH